MQKRSESLCASFPPFIESLRKHEVAIEISALPLNFRPKTQPSRVVEKFISDSEKEHQKCIADLDEKLEQTKRNSEQAITAIAEEVRTLIESTQQDIDGLIKDNTPDYTRCEPQSANYEKIYNKMRNKMVARCRMVYAKIDNFEDDLKVVEKEHMQQVKQILKHAQEKLIQFNYSNALDNQKVLENRMSQLNEASLSNQCVFNEMHLELLKLMVSNEYNWHKQIDEIIGNYEAKFEELHALKEPDDGQIQYVNNELTIEMLRAQVDEIASGLQFLEVELNGIKELLNSMLQKIYGGSYEELRYSLPQAQGIPRRDFFTVYNCVYESLWDEDYYEVITDSTLAMLKQWSELSESMQAEITNCKSSIINGMSVWDQHFIRIELVESAFVAELTALIVQGVNSDKALFSELHKVTDGIRTAPNEEQLQIAMGDCQRVIESIEKSLLKKRDAQMKYFDKYRKQVADKAELLHQDMIVYVQSQGDHEDVNSTIFRGRASQEEVKEPDPKPILMKAFEAEIKGVHNWLYGISENMKRAAELTKQIVTEYVENRIAEMAKEIEKIFQLQKRLNDEMYQEIFQYIYRTRLSELIIHEKRLNQHLLAISTELGKLYPPLAPSGNIKQDDTFIVNPPYKHPIWMFQRNIQRLNKALNGASTTSETLTIATQVKTFKNTCIATIEKVCQEIANYNNERVDELLQSNSKFVEKVQLFADGGTYTQEEYSFLKATITKSNKDISKDRENITQSVANEHKMILEELDNMENEILDKIKSINKRFEFREFLQDHLQATRQALKEETGVLLERNDILIAYVKHLQELATENLGKINYLDDFVSNCEYMEHIFKELFDKLCQQQVFNLSESIFKLGTPNWSTNDFALTTKKNLQKKLTETSVEVLDQNPGGDQDGKQLLITYVPEGNNYMANVIQILFDSIKILQKHAEEYFQATFTEDEFKEKYNNFMINHMAKYVYYQLQCDEILVQVLINYILELDDMLSFVLGYYTDSLQQFAQDKLDELHGKCKLFKNDMRMRRQAFEKQYEVIRKKLKPLHGHPNNQDLLEVLTRELHELENEAIGQQAEMDNIYNKYESLMEHNVATFQEQIDKMDARLKQCLARFLQMYIEDDRIFEQLKEKLDYFERIITHEEPIIEQSSVINIEIIEMLNSKLDVLKKGLKVSSSKFSSVLQANWSQVSSVKQKYSSFEHAATLASASSPDVQNVIETFRRDQKKCLREIENSKGIVELCQLWADIWRCDVERISALYKVKYMPLPPINNADASQKVHKATKKGKRTLKT